MLAALDRADRDRIGDEERLEPRLDDEQSCETFQHKSLSKPGANGGVPPLST
jgi:hypothetical protein